MFRRLRLNLLVLLFSLFAVLSRASNKPENWLQVTSPHFTIFCNGSEKQARNIADHFERMRLLFHTGFPKLKVDPAVPIVVIAVKDNKDFRMLEPEAYLAKGQLQLAGLFLRAPDKNYVLLRLDANGEHPYATVYHEYTHLMFSSADEWLPLWLNEGMAEFYENTELHEKDTVVGEPSPGNILWLRQNRLLPLTTLLTVDHNSPYYHEEQKGSIFYAESWALTHYLQVKDMENKTNRIADYALLVSNHVDPVTAATRAFGDLNQLQSSLQDYIAQANFQAFRVGKRLELDDTTLNAQPIPETRANALRADFLAYNQREKDARPLLDQVLKDDPNNTLAHETMGYLEFRAGHLEQAQNWYQQAVKLNSQSFLANYYFASIAMSRGSSTDLDTEIEACLEKAIKLNPSFAPSYDRLGVFYGMRHKDLDHAHLLVLQAVQLDPVNVFYRINTANILLMMERDKDAISVLQSAAPLAKTPAEMTAVQTALEAAQRLQSEREQARQFHEEMENSAQLGQPENIDLPVLQRREIVLKGPRRSVTGTIKNVLCSPSNAMDLDVVAGTKTITMHAANYYKIDFTALGFTPDSELKPCTDLEGVHAKVEYIESSAPKVNGLVTIELQK